MTYRQIYTANQGGFLCLNYWQLLRLFFDSAPKVRQESFLMNRQYNKKWPREQ
jgi:hypothetical protein